MTWATNLWCFNRLRITPSYFQSKLRRSHQWLVRLETCPRDKTQKAIYNHSHCWGQKCDPILPLLQTWGLIFTDVKSHRYSCILFICVHVHFVQCYRNVWSPLVRKICHVGLFRNPGPPALQLLLSPKQQGVFCIYIFEKGPQTIMLSSWKGGEMMNLTSSNSNKESDAPSCTHWFIHILSGNLNCKEAMKSCSSLSFQVPAKTLLLWKKKKMNEYLSVCHT